MSLSLYEQETIINYNQEERTAQIFTYSKSLISRIEKLRKRLPDDVALLREEPTGAREYRVPKSCIDIKIPPRLSEADKERRRRQGKATYEANFGAVRGRGRHTENADTETP